MGSSSFRRATIVWGRWATTIWEVVAWAVVIIIHTNRTTNSNSSKTPSANMEEAKAVPPTTRAKLIEGHSLAADSEGEMAILICLNG